jgi:hypothetical protein
MSAYHKYPEFAMSLLPSWWRVFGTLIVYTVLYWLVAYAAVKQVYP